MEKNQQNRQMSFSYKIKKNQSITILELTGKLLSNSDIEGLKKEMETIDDFKIIVDFASLTHVNSSGIGFLISILTKSRTNNGDVVLIHATKEINRIIEISRLDQIFSIFESLDEGINYYNKNQ